MYYVVEKNWQKSSFFLQCKALFHTKKKEEELVVGQKKKKKKKKKKKATCERPATIRQWAKETMMMTKMTNAPATRPRGC